MGTAHTLEPGTAEDAGFVTERIQLIRERAAGWVDQGRTPSLVALAARRGVIALHEAFGQLSFEQGSPALALDSIFPVLSMTKPVTATAAMLLVEDGKLSLNRPVVEYIPELCGKHTERILVHHLLTHTSGYPGGFAESLVARQIELGVDLPPRDETQHPDIHRQLAALYPLELRKRVGEQLIYSGHNYRLLGEIVRRISGRSFWDFVSEHIFRPLGMKDSSFRLEAGLEERIVKRSPRAPGHALLNSNEFLDRPDPPGGLLTTAGDLAIFCQAFLNGGRYGDFRLLSSGTVDEMTKNQIPGTGTVNNFGDSVPEASWGLGWMIQGPTRWAYSHGALQPRGTFHHQGLRGCGMWVDPINEIVGVYLSVGMAVHEEIEEDDWDYDLFQNMVTAAVAD